MKTPTPLLGILTLTCSTLAGVGSFVTQKKADWEFIQKTGGIEVVSRETKENRSYLNIRYDVSGLTQVTRKPELINSGIVVKDVKAWFHEESIHIEVITSTPEKNKKYDSIHRVELPEIESGIYPVFYGKDKDPEKKIGVISL